MVAALVIIGATACTENYDGIEKAEGFSFYAEIANGTRAYIADEDGDKTWETKWQLGDKLYVNGYEFVCTDVETGKFTCYNDEVAALVGQPVTITTDGNHSSYDGYEALYTTAEVESFGANAKIQLQALTSFLRFSVAGPAEVKFTLTSDAFRDQDGNNVGEVTLMDGAGEVFVAFWPGESLTATLTCYVGGVQCKSKELTFTAGKVYNLGEIVAPVASEWEISDGTRFYTTETEGLFVAKNVKLTSNSFCIHKVGDTAWGAGAKYGLVTAGTKKENTAIGLYSCNWAGDITISNATTTAHDFYFDRANSRLYVMTVGQTPDTVAAPTNSNKYNVTGSKYGWGACNAAHQFVYSGDNVWHLVVAFAANEQFKVQLNNGWTTSYGHGGIQSTVGRNLFNSSNDGNAIAKNAGTYEIWVVPSHGNEPLYIIKR